MKESLVKKIGTGIVLPILFALSSCGRMYNIGGHKVKLNPTIINSLVENRGDSLIKYSSTPYGGNLTNVKINGEKYTREDAVVYNKENKHYNYLKNKLDSMSNAPQEATGKIDWRLIRFSRNSRNF